MQEMFSNVNPDFSHQFPRLKKYKKSHNHVIYECQMCCAELQQNLENSLGNGTYHGSSEQLVNLISSSSPAYGNEQSKK